MVEPTKIPDTPLERVLLLEELLKQRATTDPTISTETYALLRSHLINDSVLEPLLPDFVRKCRSLDVFWAVISKIAEYKNRRHHIADAFTPLISHLENQDRTPADNGISDTLKAFDLVSVHSVWQKALQRRRDDPEGAITSARTLLETVCKRILDEVGQSYSDKEDLPKLYAITAKALKLAPEQHAEEAIKAILRGATTVVNGIGTLRNKLSDAHGRGGLPVRPTARHAAFAVNMAGSVAAFLVETYRERHKP
jgi:hypothetical protein